VPERRFLLLLAAAWLVLGFAAYWSILAVGFLGDDWMFLDLVSRAHDLSVLFAPLNFRYTRPLIVLVYYLNFHWFGLWPVPAHVVVVLLHIFNAWLVSALVLRLAPPPNRLMAAGAGLLFLLFAGHSEAVAWTAGMADAAIVPFLVGSLLLFDRALEAQRPAAGTIASWMVGLAGLLAKETTALVLPALVLCYGLMPRAGMAHRRRLLRTAALLLLIATSCALYLYVRTLRFGPMVTAMTGMGTSEGQRVLVGRMFFVRAFIPPGRRAYELWLYGWDMALAGAVLAAAIVVGALYKRDRARLAFVLAAFIIAIAPALPFSISITTTLTERYLYLTTVFSTVIVAWLVVRLLPLRGAAAVVLAVLAAGQWVYLARSNATWVRGDQVFRSVVSGVASIAGRQQMQKSTIVLLDVPDTIYRGCVVAAGLPIALRLQQALTDPASQLRMVAVFDAPPRESAVAVQGSGSVFTVDLGSGRLIEPPCLGRTTPEYTAISGDPHHLDVRLQRMTRRAIVVYASNDDVRVAGLVDASPFGFVDLPAGDVECGAGGVRLAGWALDDEEGLEVRVEQRSTAASPSSPGPDWKAIGPAHWAGGPRPDVAAQFPGYGDGHDPAWEFRLACAAVDVRVVARDRAGQETILGVRTVRRRQ
jgi:hypothetical protein